MDFWVCLEQVIGTTYASLSLQPSVFGCFETLLGVCRSWASPKYHLPFGDPCNSGYVCVTSTTAFMRVPGPDLWKGLSHPATPKRSIERSRIACGVVCLFFGEREGRRS